MLNGKKIEGDDAAWKREVEKAIKELQIAVKVLKQRVDYLQKRVS